MEELIKRCLLQACEEILGKTAVQKLKEIPMSAKSGNRKTEDIVEVVKNSVLINSIRRIKRDNYQGYPVCFLERIKGKTPLCSLTFLGRTSGPEILNALNGYFLKHSTEWKKSVSICKNGAVNKAGHQTCGDRIIPQKLREVLFDVIKIVNEIRHKSAQFSNV
ncbi:unnamed protein product [Soboliphyme baturini]|uniref:Reverse transcriptase domain-containing protein n=1 Tax=Soboliphyme baturini TaxID=241478 RepID=A0A183IAG6_9BILA|nr:unnamed protein product [Soboliphyme baturini]